MESSELEGTAGVCFLLLLFLLLLHSVLYHSRFGSRLNCNQN